MDQHHDSHVLIYAGVQTMQQARSAIVPAVFRFQAIASQAPAFPISTAASASSSVNTGFAASGLTSAGAGSGAGEVAEGGEGTAVSGASSNGSVGKRPKRRKLS